MRAFQPNVAHALLSGRLKVFFILIAGVVRWRPFGDVVAIEEATGTNARVKVSIVWNARRHQCKVRASGDVEIVPEDGLREGNVFESASTESRNRSRTTLTMPLALTVHALLIGILLLIPILRRSSLSSAPLFDALPLPPSGLPHAIRLTPAEGSRSVERVRPDQTIDEFPRIDPEAMVRPSEIPRYVQFFDDGVALPPIPRAGSGAGGGLGEGVDVRGLFGNSANGMPRSGGSGPPPPTPPPAPEPPRTGPVRLSAGVAEGFLIATPRPPYPELALQARVEGTVVLEAVISEDGRIRPETVRIVSGHPILARAASTAVLDWRYEPYRLNGQPVEVVTTITVSYRLR